ncbi:MAG: chaperone modulator CbpM [Thermodesulfobacteriota bacterium]
MVRHAAAGPLRGSLLALSEVARLAGVHPDLIDRLTVLGLIDPAETIPEPCFDVSAVLRIRSILRLRHDLGVNWAGVGVIMDLLERIEQLEQEIARLKGL